MTTFTYTARTTERSAPRVARRRFVAAAFGLGMLAITAGLPRLAHADPGSAAPVDQCSDFACEP